MELFFCPVIMHHPILTGLSELQANNIYAIGRNYAAHARELNNPVPDRPVLFNKPSVSLTMEGIILIPPFVKKAHYEAELVVAIGKEGKNIPTKEALSYAAGYGLGIDVTARDIQDELKEKSHPWLLAKGLDTFAPVSTFIRSKRITDPQDLSFTLEVNGEQRQKGDTSLMLFPVDKLIAFLSQFVTLLPGDLIFTGTPEGVGPLHDGDLLHANLCSGLVTMDIAVKRTS